ERMVSVLLAAAGVTPGRLQVAAGIRADPYVAVGRGYGEGIDTVDHPGVANALALLIEIGGFAIEYAAGETGSVITDMMQGRRTTGVGVDSCRRLHGRVISCGRARHRAASSPGHGCAARHHTGAAPPDGCLPAGPSPEPSDSCAWRRPRPARTR